MDKKHRNRIAIISIMTYSAKEDKAIIGYFKVSDILNGNTDEILRATGYDKRHDGHEIVENYGKNNPNCFALHLYDVTKFEEYLSLRDMRSISRSADMPQYIKFIYDNDPLYEVIREWDEAFSLDGNLCDNPSKTKQMILQKAKMKGRK